MNEQNSKDEPEQKPQSELAKEFRAFLKNDPLNFHKEWIRLSYEACNRLDETEQKPQSEFTAKYRRIYRDNMIACRWNRNCGEAFLKTCKRLDEALAEIRKLKGD